MNRIAALTWLQNTGFNAAMTEIGRTTDDEPAGYGPALDRAFAVHAGTVDLVSPIDEVDAAYDLQFSILLEAVTADLISIGYARMVDVSVDAPLTSAKMSQAWRQFNTLRERLWKEASFYGYVTSSNVGGWSINMDYLEPSGTEWVTP